MPENFILRTVYIRSLMLFLRAGVEKKKSGHPVAHTGY